jgi:cytochrome c553
VRTTIQAKATVLVLLLMSATGALPQDQVTSEPPPWAYLVNTQTGPSPTADDGTMKHVPGSSKAMTLTQVRDGFNLPDWHPDEHPPMPEVVEHGRKPDVRACGWCHMPDGIGRPENAGLSGLPASYIVQQIADFRNGVRKSSQPKFGPLMAVIAKAASDSEVQAAAEYFSALKPRQWIRVVETETVPKTAVAGMLVPVEGGGREPIGQRIIEIPENPVLTELRDGGSGFVAYVPAGVIAKGDALVTNGGGKTTPCGICHGSDLKGLGPVPGIAGRSPSYIFRQLYDIQHGVRKGEWTDLMKAPVAHLTQEDMIAVAAYTSSRMP